MGASTSLTPGQGPLCSGRFAAHWVKDQMFSSSSISPISKVEDTLLFLCAYVSLTGVRTLSLTKITSCLFPAPSSLSHQI